MGKAFIRFHFLVFLIILSQNSLRAENVVLHLSYASENNISEWTDYMEELVKRNEFLEKRVQNLES